MNRPWWIDAEEYLAAYIATHGNPGYAERLLRAALDERHKLRALEVENEMLIGDLDSAREQIRRMRRG